MADIQPGNIVKLKSGGPKMTVDSLGSQIVCVWFKGAKVRSQSFKPESLRVLKRKRARVENDIVNETVSIEVRPS